MSDESLGLAFSSQRRGHAVRLVVEAVGKNSAKSRISPSRNSRECNSTPLVEQLPTTARGAIAYRLLRFFLQQAHAPQPVEVARVTGRDLAQEAAVDLVDDLQMPR